MHKFTAFKIIISIIYLLGSGVARWYTHKLRYTHPCSKYQGEIEQYLNTTNRHHPCWFGSFDPYTNNIRHFFNWQDLKLYLKHVVNRCYIILSEFKWLMLILKGIWFEYHEEWETMRSKPKVESNPDSFWDYVPFHIQSKIFIFQVSFFFSISCEGCDQIWLLSAGVDSLDAEICFLTVLSNRAKELL